MNIEKHLHSLLRPIFPDSMEITRISPVTIDDMVFRVRAKYSRPIEITFSDDVIDDYRDDPTYRDTMVRFISAYLRARFAQYVDDGVLVPAVKWQVKPENYLPGPPQPGVRLKPLTTAPR